MEGVALGCGCLLGGCAAFLFVWARIDGSGTSRRRKISRRNGGDALVSWFEYVGHWAPVVRLANKGSNRALASRLADACAAKGRRLTENGAFAGALCALVAAGLAGLLVSMSLLGAAVGVAGAFAGVAAFVGRHERRQRDVACAQMPEVLRSFAATLGAGKSLAQSIDHVGATVGEPLGSEFLRVSFEIRSGRSVCDAVDALGNRLDVPGLSLLGAALQISQRTGAPLGALLDRTTRMVGETVGMRRELMAKTSQVRLSARVVSLLPVVLVGLLTLMSADYRAGLALPAGRACICLAALMDIVALVLMKRIMNGVL